MSVKHPIISVTGSSGAGTTSVKNTFEQIFRREKVEAAFIEGDAFHRFDRMRCATMAAEALKGNGHFSHFGLEPTSSPSSRRCSGTMAAAPAARGTTCTTTAKRSATAPAGHLHRWQTLPDGTDLLFYEGLHGAVVTEEVNLARHADLKIGVVPVINLEWIQKLHRDRSTRGYSTEAVTDTILRRMPDYVRYICPQFTETDINFQRVPTVDTSNPFIARWIPTPDESMVVIRFRNPRGIDFAYLRSMIHDSFMSRPNSIVIPGGKLDLAMQLILTPMILQLVERKRRAS